MSIIDQMNTIIIILTGLLGIGVLAFLIIQKKIKTEERQQQTNSNNNLVSAKKETSKDKNKFDNIQRRPVDEFMEFDKVEDNMIITDGGSKYLMVLKCEGINYYLMSEAEKLATEQGFIQFLNTLSYPVQLYVQSRRTNLNENLDNYKEKIEVIEDEVGILKEQLKILKNMPNSNKQQIDKLQFELLKKQNVYEYGLDITDYIRTMSLNKNILLRTFYVIVPYYSSELGLATSFSEEEKQELSYVELYTRCRALASSLSSCSVESKILNSEELCELLYIAYNRDDSTLLDMKKSLEADFYRLYSTSKTILQRKQEVVNQEILERGIKKAQEAIDVVTKEDIISEDFDEKHEKEIDKTAVEILDNSRQYFAGEIIDKAKRKVKNKIVPGRRNIKGAFGNITPIIENKKKKNKKANTTDKTAKKGTRGRKPKREAV